MIMQIKTTMRYYFTYIRMVVFKNRTLGTFL